MSQSATTLYLLPFLTSITCDDHCIACTLPLPCCHLLTTAAPQTSRWSSCGWCRLLSDQYHVGSYSEKISRNNSTVQYLQICPVSSNPIPVSF